MSFNKKVVITGSIAVGKSSIIKELQKHIPEIHLVPEYIDVLADGVEMLNKYFRRDITPYQFQNYILNYYRDYLKNNQHPGVMVFERIPDDGIVCFSNLDNANGKLSDEEFYSLYTQVLELDKEYHLPTYFSSDKNQVFIPVKTVNSEVDGKLIAEIIKVRPEAKIIIGLYNSANTCYDRLCVRNREGETTAYSRKHIENLTNHYRQLYKVLMSDEKLRFVGLGKLV